MRVEIKKVKYAKFIPMELKIKIETIEEARSFFHIFNHCGLDDVFSSKELFSKGYYSYKNKSAILLGPYDEIKSHILDCGMEL